MGCYCGSDQVFANCCQPFLTCTVLPQTAPELMRSRYSAYCTGHIQYIKNTYHPSQQSDQAEADIAAFADAAHFVGLSVLPISDKSLLQQRMPDNPYLESYTGTLSLAAPDSAKTVTTAAEGCIDYVHFIARFIMQDKLQQLEEQSRFIFEQQQWWYLDGCLFSHAGQKINRNDACPCGSGKKYKVCRPHLMSAQQS